MKIGFTGTRSGMSEKQKREVTSYMLQYPEIKEAHHGMCIGADANFNEICIFLKIPFIGGHPGKSAVNSKSTKRPFRSAVHVDKKYPEDTHFSRNRTIVDTCDILLACPYNNIERGGTWYTINYAKKIGKSYIIFTR